MTSSKFVVQTIDSRVIQSDENVLFVSYTLSRSLSYLLNATARASICLWPLYEIREKQDVRNEELDSLFLRLFI